MHIPYPFIMFFLHCKNIGLQLSEIKLSARYCLKWGYYQATTNDAGINRGLPMGLVWFEHERMTEICRGAQKVWTEMHTM